MGYSKAYLHDPCPSVMKEQLKTLSISFFKFTFFKLTGMGNLRWKKYTQEKTIIIFMINFLYINIP